MVAHANPAGAEDPRGLTQREHAIAVAAARGLGNKAIAYELGVTESAIGTAVARVLRKLALRSRSELALLFAPFAPRTRARAVSIAGERLAIVNVPRVPDAPFDELSSVEREVAQSLIEGATHASIALRRGTSVRTVANQAASIYRKLGVRSRAELAARALAIDAARARA